MLKAIVLFSLILVVIIPNGIAVAAQDEPIAISEAPDPALCTLDPRTIEALAQLIDQGPVTQTPAPLELSDPFEMPPGYSLFEDERTEVVKDLRRAVACFNTGDPLKVFATYTDRYVLALIDRLGGLTPAVQNQLQTVVSVPADRRIEILSFGESVLLEDGRVAIIVLGDDPTDTDPPARRLFLLEEVKPGRWLIDDVFDIDDRAGN